MLCETWASVCEDWARVCEDWARVCEDWARVCEDWARVCEAWARLCEAWARLCEAWVQALKHLTQPREGLPLEAPGHTALSKALSFQVSFSIDILQNRSSMRRRFDSSFFRLFLFPIFSVM